MLASHPPPLLLGPRIPRIESHSTQAPPRPGEVFRQGRTQRIYRKRLTHFSRVSSPTRASPDRNPASRTP